ncbi:hypothetical protein RIF29_23906 [Crotalaria pallida]|uniref:Uncharacterized protein n=1 Tax=Crotalaria pallida TaxID=3830 RepID=A0AAN9EQW9_CROPI
MTSSSAPKRMRSPDAKPAKHLILVTLSKLKGSTDLQVPLNSGRRIFKKMKKVYGFPKDNVTWFLGADLTKPINPHFKSKDNFSNHVRSVFDDASPDDVVPDDVLMVYSGYFKPMRRHHHDLIFEGVGRHQLKNILTVKSLVRMPDENARLSVKYPFISLYLGTYCYSYERASTLKVKTYWVLIEED